MRYKFKFEKIYDPGFDFRNAQIVPKSKSYYLNKLISLGLQTDKPYRDLISNAMDDLCHHIQHNCDYSANRMIKGGSLGKGTALKGSSDLDCVLVLNDIEDAHDLMDNIDDVKDDLKSCVTTAPAQSSYLRFWEIRFEHFTNFSIQFIMTKRSPPREAVEVDLLPTFNIPNSDSLADVYREMRRSNKKIQQYYSAALTEFQRDFVKQLPARIKDLIRLVKYWCKRFVKQEVVASPSSYLLELITIHAWEKVGKPTTINMAIAFKAVMQELKDYQYLDAVWHVYYSGNQEMNDQPPRVLDPANPFNNVCARVDWEHVAQIAHETMQKPLFRDIEITTHWCRGPPPKPSRRRRRKQSNAACCISNDEFKDFRFLA